MNAAERVAAYRKQAGVEMDKPFILTPAQRRRIKQKSNRCTTRASRTST